MIRLSGTFNAPAVMSALYRISANCVIVGHAALEI